MQRLTGTMTPMKRILYIAFFTLIFLCVSLLLQFHLIEAMPIALLGGCIGWALAEFRRETKAKKPKH